MTSRTLTLLASATLLASFVISGCKTTPTTSPDAGSANTSPTHRPKPEPTVSGAPIPKTRVQAAVNPNHKKPYSGPTGTISGTITIQGDPPPDVPLELTPKCSEARRYYGKLFREGPGRTLADVLVAVTNYGTAYVPAKSNHVDVKIRACAFDTRTVALTYGQHIEVSNLDNQSFIPSLIGERTAALMVATPGGSPVKLYPRQVGHYLLAENMKHPWMKADVIVLKYSTFDVTGLDGKYEITGVPVGKVQVNAFLPAIDVTEMRRVKVEKGKTSTVDIKLTYKKKASAATSSSVPKRSKPSVPLVH